MQLPQKYNGYIICEFYDPLKRDRISTKFLVDKCMNTMIIFDDFKDLKWKAEYLKDEDTYAITNSWSKTSETWSITDKVDFARRIKITDVIKINQFKDFVDEIKEVL